MTETLQRWEPETGEGGAWGKPDAFERVVLTPDEVREVDAVVAEIAARWSAVEDPAMLRQLPAYSRHLPQRVWTALTELRLREPSSGVCVLAGFPIDEDRIGPTPPRRQWDPSRSRVLREELLLLLVGSVLGEAIAWATEQGGHLVHDILPVAADEDKQLGSGSREPLLWHTEDAFHELRADYVGMMSLRNPGQIATTVASISGTELDRHHVDLLFQPLFSLRPDESHLRENKQYLERLGPSQRSALERIERMDREPERIPLLSGHPDSPYLRIDLAAMGPPPDLPEARAALAALVAALEGRLTELVLMPGEICFLDNHRVVHGRRPFKAAYDGKDRWLKRIIIARDLKKSRHARSDAESRVIC